MMPRSSAVPVCTAIAGVLGISAAWIAVGSIGIVAQPLGRVLVALILGLVILLARPVALRSRLVWLPIGLLGVPVLTFAPPEYELLLTVTVFAFLAGSVQPKQRAVFVTCAAASLVLAIHHVLQRSSSWVWLAGDSVAGEFARRIDTRNILGATYGGLNFLVLAGAFILIWLTRTRPVADGDGKLSSGLRRAALLRRAIIVFAFLLAGHALYLVLLSNSLQWKAMLPVTPERPFEHPYVPPPWEWASLVGDWLPWNVPVLGAVIQAVVLFTILRWPAATEPGEAIDTTLDSPWWATNRIACACAVLLAASATLELSDNRCSLTGRVVLASNQGRLDWQTPEHDKYGQASAGMFGILPSFIASLGGQMTVSDRLTDDELDRADAVVLLHPTGAIAEDQLRRIWRYVESGGSLLVAGEPYVYDGGVASNFNEILAPTSIRVQRDVAISETGNWRYALQPFAHPVTTGMPASVRGPFTDSGSSLSIHRPARPLVVGRWGWSDPGSEAMTSGVYHLDEGERLGDVVLLAEQRVGRGKVLVLGDTTFLTNEGIVHRYDFAGRLLSYLTSGGADTPQVAWRQVATLVFSILLIIMALYRSTPLRIAGIALTLVLSLAAFDAWNRSSAVCVPRIAAAAASEPANGLSENNLPGNGSAPWKGIAYIDTSHVQGDSNSEWGFDATNGLALTLMRNRYLTFALPELTPIRLHGAKVVVSIAPGRQFTAHEIGLIDRFVRDGGIWISTVGAEQVAASAGLLAHFGLRVPASPVPTGVRLREPEPMGHFRAAPVDSPADGIVGYRGGVTFHAAWPVEFESEDTEVLVAGADDRPVVVCRQFGQGKFVLIGDSGFAMNKNLEYIGGQPFEHGYENAEFWRWLLERAGSHRLRQESEKQ